LKAKPGAIARGNAETWLFESVNLSKTSERIQRHTRAKPFAEWRCFGSLMTRVSINFKKDGLPGQARQ
jgi:hypothetical protein